MYLNLILTPIVQGTFTKLRKCFFLFENEHIVINSTNDPITEDVAAENMIDSADNIKVSYNLKLFTLLTQISPLYLKDVLKTELDEIKKEIDSSEDDNSHQDDTQADVRIPLITYA